MLSNAAKNSGTPKSNPKKSANKRPDEWSEFSDQAKNGGFSMPDEPRPNRRQILSPSLEKPEPNEKERARLQRLAKVNALGKGFGSIFQLLGVASGGDANNYGDEVGDFVLSGLKDLDNDYRQKLKGYNDQMFQVDLYNNQAANRQAQGDEAYERGKEQYETRTDDALRMRMMQEGIDPNDPEAVDLYTKQNASKFELDKKNANSLIAQRTGSGKGSRNIDPEMMATIMKGRAKKLTELKSQLSKLASNNKIGQNDGQIEAINKQIGTLTNLDADPENLLVNELYQLGSQPDQPEPKNTNAFAGMGVNWGKPPVNTPGIQANTNKGTTPDSVEKKNNLYELSPKQLYERIKANPKDEASITILSEAMVKSGQATDLEEARSKILGKK
jgi:hypothetical protein